jgi:hypothetical protein
VYVDRRNDNHRENLYRYSVHRRADLLERIIPFFREHPLRSAKRLHFDKSLLARADGRRSAHDPRGSGADRRDHADDEPA